jgi:hypothetical protein
MVLFDDILPPLEDNTYRVTVETDVTIDGTAPPLDPNSTDPLTKQSFFTIQGPRFQLAPTEVAGVFPPSNGHGSFSETVPHIVLLRRTLPWERPLDPANKIPAATVQPGDATPPAAPAPWLALLVFAEGETFQILKNLPLEQIVGPSIYADLGSPPNVNCDAVQTDLSTLDSLLPYVEELTLLTHVRQVNIDDRELNIGSTNGFFAVVMSNRLLSTNTNYTACLVSLEARSDIVSPGPSSPQIMPPDAAARPEGIVARPEGIVAFPSPVLIGAVGTIGFINPIVYFNRSVQLVLLHSWKFATTGAGSFRDLMQGLNVAMYGSVANPGHPPLTDTCHIPMDMQDRAGEPEKVFYRGPLTPFQLTRDALGPYHSADQCVRATPETGGKDISYAAAFEVGRLIAASDKSLASALMQWRRDAYTQASRADTLLRAQTALAINAVDLHAPVLPFLSTGAATLVAQGSGPISDPFGIDKVQTVVGMNPGAVQQAFNLDSSQQAIAILGGDPGATGASIFPIVQTARAETTIDAVASDATALGRLGAARGQVLANTTVQLQLPAVNSIEPTTGPAAGGTTVTVTGVRFTGATAVMFGPVAATTITVVSDTQLTAVSPSQDAAGQNAVDVTVTTSAGSSLTTPADLFTYSSEPPSVSGINPTSGPAAGGTSVTVTGTGFTGVSGVNFGSSSVNFNFVSDTQIVATSPPGENGATVDVTVTTPAGTSASGTPDKFAYLASPTMIAIKPNVGPPAGRIKIVIIGGGFTGATVVNFGDIAALEFVVESDREIVAVVPPGQGTVPVTVTTPAGTSSVTQAGLFHYISQPVVTGVNPPILVAGQSTNISGAGFTGAVAVAFGTAPAPTFKIVSDNEISVVVPAGSGIVDVTVTTSGGTSAITAADKFTYISIFLDGGKP